MRPHILMQLVLRALRMQLVRHAVAGTSLSVDVIMTVTPINQMIVRGSGRAVALILDMV